MNLWLTSVFCVYLGMVWMVLGWGLRNSLGAVFWFFLFPCAMIFADFFGFSARASFSFHEPTPVDFCVVGLVAQALFEFFMRNLAPSVEQWWLAFLFRLAAFIPWGAFLFFYVAPAFLSYAQARSVLEAQVLWVLIGTLAIQFYIEDRAKKEEAYKARLGGFKSPKKKGQNVER